MIAIRSPGRAAGIAGNLVSSVRSWQVWELPEPLRSYVLAVSVIYAGLLAFAAASATWHARDALVFLALLACGIAATEANR